MHECMVAGDRKCSCEENVHVLQEWPWNIIFEEKGTGSCSPSKTEAKYQDGLRRSILS